MAPRGPSLLTPFVVDASVIACGLLPDEADPIADATFARLPGDPGIVPAHWWFEIRNILLVSERRGRIPQVETSGILELLVELPISTRFDPREGEILRLARAHRLSFYDAAYLELAEHAGVPLATLDHDLAAAARSVGVTLIAAKG